MASAQLLNPADFQAPAMLLGPVDYDMYRDFRAKLGAVLGTTSDGSRVNVELLTLGGDPAVARMMGGGSRITMAELLEKVPSNWYIEADEAVLFGLVTTII